MRWRRLSFRAWRALRACAGLGTAGLLAILLGGGFFTKVRLESAGAARIEHLAAVCLLLALVSIKMLERVLITPPPPSAGWRELARECEFGLILVVATFAALELMGGHHAPLYPLVYILVTYLIAFHSLGVGLTLVGVVLALEVATNPDRGLLSEHVAFILFFAGVHVVFLHAELWRGRREWQQRIEGEIRSMRDEARDFRLISSGLGAESRVRTREEEEAKLAQGAVETIHQSLFYTLELLKKSLDLHTCVLLWLDDSGEKLKIKELVTDSDFVVESDVPALAGALGACIKDRLLINLRTPTRGQVPYYRGPEDVGAFVAVPVTEAGSDDAGRGHLRGVLAADRLVERPFDARDEQLLVGATGQILRAIQAERVFAAVERSKYEKERFFRASEMLNSALTLDQVYDVALRGASEIVAFDFAAITLFAKDTRKHTVCRVEGDGKKSLEGLTFSENAGLVAMVVKNKHHLPASGGLRGEEAPVFTKKVKSLRGYDSLLVLPLVCADEAIGSLTLAARRRNLFTKDKREMLGVIGNQVAVSIENAKMYRMMEEMATTDGLTGLLNHRTFQERIVMMLERSERLAKRCTLILCDIDHFKGINDTHGHPVGDLVLRRVAQVLAATVRKIDLVARYGGEEFAIVLEETDTRGAHELAERIRAEVARQAFTSDKGPFQVTLSLGVATYPQDGDVKQALIEHADRALYAAKHGGRNRTVHFGEMGRERSGATPLRQVQA